MLRRGTSVHAEKGLQAEKGRLAGRRPATYARPRTCRRGAAHRAPPPAGVDQEMSRLRTMSVPTTPASTAYPMSIAAPTHWGGLPGRSSVLFTISDEASDGPSTRWAA